jgi:hydroxyacylglutathione hydrolase
MRRFREIAAGVLVATAEQLTSTSTVVEGNDGGCLLIDPAVSRTDLSELAADLTETGLRPVAGFATHPHWDHVLWSRELGDVPRYASPDCVQVMQATRADQAAYLQQRMPGHDLELFGELLALPDGDSLVPWDGPDVQVIVHNGHTPGHAALFVRDAGVLVAGDMLSDIEIPLLDTEADDPLGDYRAGLARLAALSGVSWVVPGHGHVGDAAEFRRRVAADAAYLDLLAAGEPFDDPRATVGWQRDAHAEHLRVVAGLESG